MTRHDTFFFSLPFCSFLLSFSFMHTSTPSNDTHTMHRRSRTCLCRCLLRQPHAHMYTYIYLYTYNTLVHVYAPRTGVFSAGQVAVCVCFDHLIRTCIYVYMCIHDTHEYIYAQRTGIFGSGYVAVCLGHLDCVPKALARHLLHPAGTKISESALPSLHLVNWLAS